MRRGEIWHVDLDPVQGSEIKRQRFILIVSTAEFNRTAGLAIVCPITMGGDFARDRGFAVPLSGAGTRTQGVAVVNHLRAIDLKARRGKKVEAVPDYIIEDVLLKIQAIFELDA